MGDLGLCCPTWVEGERFLCSWELELRFLVPIFIPDKAGYLEDASMMVGAEPTLRVSQLLQAVSGKDWFWVLGGRWGGVDPTERAPRVGAGGGLWGAGRAGEDRSPELEGGVEIFARRLESGIELFRLQICGQLE